ncbi:hypothetical protein ZIOFF_052315 [Zingiber officinale]|uniref:Pentatricopeptide repeat-containing protein n=1 Tax=Zingiber officinale TaxID=94328 RepID=A0A8J5KVB5_ZINOF|nr:hypothetical protein ZIOFF_052315 [Zingiber officinale]
MFDEMSDGDGVTYSTLITGYMSYRLVASTIELFQKVDSSVLITWNAVIAGLAHNDNHGQVLVSVPVQSYHEQNIYVATTLIDTFAKADSLEAVRRLNQARRCDIHDDVTFTTVMSAYAHAGAVTEARSIFDAMTSSMAFR